MDWLTPDDPDRLAGLVRERAGGDGPLLATGAAAPPEAARRPPEAGDAVVFSTARLNGSPDLRPRDLTVSVPAGVRVADLQRSLAGEGLWLALGGPALRRSVGGAVAAAPPGPWDLAFGDLGRQLLACRLVTWSGTRARWGRAVMKDVAGYGTTRAAAGSFGRLGVLHRAVFRVWPLPEASRAVELVPAGGDDRAAAARLAASDLDARVRPDALRWERSPATGEGGRIEAWLVGSEASVAERAERLAARAGDTGLEVAGERADFDPLDPGGPGAAGGRRPEVGVVTLRPGRAAFGDTARRAVDALGGDAVRVVGHPLAGVLRCAWRRDGPPDAAETGTFPAEAASAATLDRLLEAVGDVPVRLEHGTAGELAALEARRPGGARDLERRALEALEGRRRHWLSTHL